MSVKKNGYKVKDLVIDDEYATIDSNANVVDAAKKMKEKNVPDLVVIEGKDEKVLGIIADNDIVNEVVAMGKIPEKTNVKVAMYKIDPVSLDTPVEEAFKRMQNLKVGVVPVVEKGKLHGVCTIHDCWSYIPEEGADKVGLIPVANSRLAEFWIGSVTSILAFILGIVFPLTGVFGFFTADTSQLSELFKIAEIRGGPITFSLFEAHGTQFFINYVDLATKAGSIWMILFLVGLALLIVGFMGLFSIFYSSFAVLKGSQPSKIHQRIMPLLTILLLILEWVIFAITLSTATPHIIYTVDGAGLTCSIIAMILILIAIFRDYIFIQKAGGN